MTPQKRVIANASSWIVESDCIELALTEHGGMMAPVHFYRDTDDPIQPYYISPWQGEGLAIGEPVLEKLRGDFFCLPFGAAGTYRTEQHVTHGETATEPWTLERYERTGEGTVFEASLATRVRPASVRKRITLRPGQNVVYQSHSVSGLRGRSSVGHHTTLAGGTTPGRLAISTSPIRFGLTDPRSPGPHAGGEYFALAPGATFDDLRRVPTIWRDEPEADCSRFPARHGFVDMLGLIPEARAGEPAWVTAVAVREGYLWFALKDPRVLPTTMLWMENHGRHQPPWNGRNCCIGIEDICGFLAHGLAESISENSLTERDVPTSVDFDRTDPVEVHYVQGVVRIPPGYDRTATAEFEESAVRFTAESGKQVEAAVRPGYVFDGEPT